MPTQLEHEAKAQAIFDVKTSAAVTFFSELQQYLQEQLRLGEYIPGITDVSNTRKQLDEKETILEEARRYYETQMELAVQQRYREDCLNPEALTALSDEIEELYDTIIQNLNQIRFFHPAEAIDYAKEYEEVYDYFREELIEKRRQIIESPQSELLEDVQTLQQELSLAFERIHQLSSTEEEHFKQEDILELQKIKDYLSWLGEGLAAEDGEYLSLRLKLAKDELKECYIPKLKTEMETLATIVETIINEVENLEQKDNSTVGTTRLLKTLTSTRQLLEREMDVAEFQSMADDMQRDPSKGLQVLGGILLALAVALTIVVFIACPGAIALLSGYIGLSLGTTTLLAEGTIAGLYAGGIAATLFGCRGTESRLIQPMSQLASQVQDLSKTEEKTLPDLGMPI